MQDIFYYICDTINPRLSFKVNKYFHERFKTKEPDLKKLLTSGEYIQDWLKNWLFENETVIILKDESIWSGFIADSILFAVTIDEQVTIEFRAKGIKVYDRSNPDIYWLLNESTFILKTSCCIDTPRKYVRRMCYQ